MTAVASGVQANRLPITSSRPAGYFANNMAYAMNERRMSSANEGLHVPTALILRRLPLTTTTEAVRTMLLFAKDLQDMDMVPTEYEEDKGFATAIARFSSLTGASEAQAMLDGKPNTAGQANMVVEILTSPMISSGFRRNTIDPSLSRPTQQATSPGTRPIRYNGSFEPMTKLSPAPAASTPNGMLSDNGSAFPGMFQTQSPRLNGLKDRSRISGKSMIGEDGGDEDTDGLLKDTLSYMKQDPNITARRGSNGPRNPISNFNNLSLNTKMAGVNTPSYLTPRSAMGVHSPHTPFSPGTGPYVTSNPYLRHNYPPVNPADQNPPCNTLYVGNLPMDTSEDELKAMFSKQRGYKRLCFRTKQNGPMCFVEFEDISFATKALNELYGAQLHNSVKGGIRLSFSKNPLGVRAGQSGNGANPSTPLNSPGPSLMNGMSVMSPGGFTTANGPPPGLSAPPGFPQNGGAGTSQYAGLGMRNLQVGASPDMNAMYPDYMLGR